MGNVTTGLRGVYALQSRICSIDGDKGVLSYCGYDIRDLAKNATFEEVTYLLWNGTLPTKAQLRKLSNDLKANRAVPKRVLDLLRDHFKREGPMEGLKTALSLLARYDPDDTDMSPKANMRKAIRLTAKCATVVAAYERIRQGKRVVAPKKELSHAANFLYMLTGKKPSKLHETVMDKCLILHAEHSLNASTFAARVTASTLSDIYSTVTSAIGALKGPLHGGANTRVMKMLKEVKSPKNARAYLTNKLKKHERVMGFGHRVYRVKDPRAYVLESFLPQLAEEGDPKYYRISKEIETVMAEFVGSKGIYPNVDFFSASVYRYLGIPMEIYTPVFAIARMSGWLAHVMEQYSDNALIRPRAQYVGKKNLKYSKK